MEAYFRLADNYWGTKAGRASVCLDHVRRHGWSKSMEPRSPFATLGLEGSGHHLLMELPPSLCGRRKDPSVLQCGGQLSFSFCGGCGKEYPSFAWRTFSNATALNPNVSSLFFDRAASPSPFAGMLRMRPPGKFVVLVRDPADAIISALRRFWKSNDTVVDTLDREMEAADESLRALSAQLDTLPCERTLFLAYELLHRFPATHAAPLAAFLGVPQRDPMLRRFLADGIRTDRSSSTWAPTRVPLPEAVGCDALLARKLMRHAAAAAARATPASAALAAWPTAECLSDDALGCLRSFREALHARLRERGARYAALLPRSTQTRCARVREERRPPKASGTAHEHTHELSVVGWLRSVLG